MSDAAPALRLRRLGLTDFRNYARLDWRPAGRIAVITGPNGSGKTNLLEAISLLVPGRGLRGARGGDLARVGGAGWAVASRLETPAGEVDIGTGTSPEGGADRRVFRLDGAAPRSQAEIAARVAAVWLTPQMDRLFQEGASGRRRFLDRLVYALEPGHAREVASYEAATASRNRLLGEGRADPAWLAGLEDAMARHGVAATVARMGLVRRLNETLGEGAVGAFPVARMSLVCAIAAQLEEAPALAVEDWLRETLAGARGRDAAAGGASVGAHRADMDLADAATGIPAARASTGQQKSLLIAVILGHAALLASARGFAPLLLLDEPVVHLDQGRREALFAALAALPAQAFLTGTDAEVFAPLAGVAEGLRTGGDGLVADPGFPGPSDVAGGQNSANGV